MNKNTPLHLKSQAIYIDGKDRTDEIESYSFKGGKCVVIYKNNGKSYSYHQNKIILYYNHSDMQNNQWVKAL